MTGRKHPPTHRKKRAEIGPRPYLDNIETLTVIPPDCLGLGKVRTIITITVRKG